MAACNSQSGLSASLASTGQQKALLIAVVLAHARLQARRLRRPPVLLLDDVVAGGYVKKNGDEAVVTEKGLDEKSRLCTLAGVNIKYQSET